MGRAFGNNKYKLETFTSLQIALTVNPVDRDGVFWKVLGCQSYLELPSTKIHLKNLCVKFCIFLFQYIFRLEMLLVNSTVYCFSEKFQKL